MKKAREYRKETRELLGHEIFGSKWMWALLILLVEGAIVGALSATGVGAIPALLIIGPLSYGVIDAFVKVARKEKEHAKNPNGPPPLPLRRR